jgi:Transposase DNA-binding/Transposase Tn5 dimerisation domain/Transposase DDE domain
MIAPWVIEETKDVDLQDKRLNDRLAVILDLLGGHPTASIPAACGGYNEMMAAYRFFNNDKIGFENVLQPHIAATARRMAEHRVVILAQDTTEIDLTRPERQVVGAGPLDGDVHRGALLHPLMGFTPDGTPLGIIYAEVWTRDEAPTTPKSQRELDRRRTPIEEKESMRWVDAFRHASEQAEQLPQTQFICTADSEADIYELLQESQEESHKLDYIVRACHDRALQKDEEHAETGANHLREQVLSEGVLFTKTISVRGRKAKVGCDTRGRRQPRESRTAEVEVRAARVTLRAPWRPDRKLDDISVNVVLVTEIDPPEGDTPVEWILLTSLPIDDLEQVRTVIQYYCVRWMIEVFFRTLKSGCRVEKRRLEHIDGVLPCLAVYLIVTWRTLFVCRLGREFPEISCEAVFEPAEWKSVYYVVRKTPPPSCPPTLQEMVRMVAQLGGYVNRKRTDEPGPQTVWLGLQRTHDIANCWQIFGPESKNEEILV